MPWLYSDPATMNYDMIDEAIRELVRTINGSDWMLTEESCSGHSSNEPTAWGHARELYLRLVVKAKDIKRFLFFADRLRKLSYTGMAWHVSILYDRSDELGTHWCLTFDYGPDISYRSMAVDITLRAFNESSLITDPLSQELIKKAASKGVDILDKKGVVKG